MEENNLEKINLIKKAFEFKAAKRYKESVEYFQKVLDNFTSNQEDIAEIYSQIADIYLITGDKTNALEKFKEVLKIKKNHIFSLQKTFEIYMFQKKYDKAMTIAQKMTEIAPDIYSYYNYFEVLIAIDKHQDAIEIFNQLDETIKLDTNILYLISTITPEEKKIPILERVIALDENHKKANLELAKLEFKNGKYSKVVDYCLNIDEENALSNYYLGMVEFKRGNFSKAIEFLVKAINLDKDEHDFKMDLARVFLETSNFSPALSLIKESINFSLAREIKEGLDEKYFLASWILIKQNESQKALLYLDSIKTNSKYYRESQILVQIIDLKNSNIVKAKETLEGYLSEEYDNPVLLEGLAKIYKELKQYKNAINIYKKAYKIYPDSIYYPLEMIDLLIDDKNYDEAFKLIKSLDCKFEKCPSIYNSLTRIYYRLKDLDKALENIECYLKLDFNNPEAYYFKGLILNDLGRYSIAKTMIYTAIKFNPNVAKYYSQMARAYFGLNELEEALLYAKEAIELNGNEISYKKQAYEIALKIGDKNRIKIFETQLKRSETILRERN